VAHFGPYNGRVEHADGRPIGELIRLQNIVLKGADLLTIKGYTSVPNHILVSTKISPGAKLAYTMLLKYAWEKDFCFPGQETLAKDMGSGVRSIVRYMQELEKAGFLKIVRRGQGKSNLYEMNMTRKDVA
jgi:hypothetical protein